MAKILRGYCGEKQDAMSPDLESGLSLHTRNSSHLYRDMTTEEKVDALEDELDCILGLRYWEKYYSIFFWSNFTTPINVLMAVCSILTASHTMAGFVPTMSIKGSALVSAILAAVMTFLKPQAILEELRRLKNQWCAYGAEFDAIYFADLTPQDRAAKYRDLRVRISRESETPQDKNHTMEWFVQHVMFRKLSYKWRDICHPCRADESIHPGKPEAVSTTALQGCPATCTNSEIGPGNQGPLSPPPPPPSSGPVPLQGPLTGVGALQSEAGMTALMDNTNAPHPQPPGQPRL